MARLIIERLLFFTIPFALYASYLVVQMINPFTLDRWTRRVLVPLTLAGLICAVGSILAYGIFADRHVGGYRPAHIEDGRLVPGRMQ